MNSNLAEAASLLLANHDTKEDLDILEHVIAERPYVVRGVSEKVKIFKERLGRATQATRPMLRDKPSASVVAADSAAARAEKQSVANTSGNASTGSLMIWVIAGIVISGLVWLLLRMRHEREP